MSHRVCRTFYLISIWHTYEVFQYEGFFLRTVRECNLPDWFVGAGVIRSLVWDHLHGHSGPTPVKDVDVVYFDAFNLSQKHDQDILVQLIDKFPDVPWEVTNQAAVHLWFKEYFGYSYRGQKIPYLRQLFRWIGWKLNMEREAK